MDATYKLERGLKKHRLRHIVIVGIISVTVLAVLGGATWRLIGRNTPKAVTGGVVTVPQQITTTSVLNVNEPYFTMQLPADWKQTSGTIAGSFSWQATAKNEDARFLTIYIDDAIPANLPVNRELPLTAQGNQLTYGQLSPNCATFTAGGTLETTQAVKLKPALAVWQNINFICNLPNVVDNQIGTGSMAGVNTITLTGPTAGTHSYFFLYTDRTGEPDYDILYNIIQSFRAK